LHEPGEILDGKYRLVELIGEGGMGSVFLAKHTQLGKSVAIKFLNREEDADDKVVARFQREAMAAASVGHRGIIDVYDIGTSELGSPYLVMEYLEGESLRELIEAEQKLDVSTTAFITAQVLAALDAAHSKGIVHRDLKPDNVFLADVGRGAPEIKLLDFGISKIVDHQIEGKSITTTGTVLGTPCYMSPEQARGKTDVDGRADIYAMGVILYECMTGVLPTPGRNYNEIIVQILMKEPTPPIELVPELPPELEAVMLKALAKDPDERHQTARELVKDLLPYVSEDQTELIDHGTGRVLRSGKLSTRHATSSAEGDEGGDFETGRTLQASTGDSLSSLERAPTSGAGWHSVSEKARVALETDSRRHSVAEPTPTPSPVPISKPATSSRLWLVGLVIALSLAAGTTLALRLVSSDGQDGVRSASTRGVGDASPPIESAASVDASATPDDAASVIDATPVKTDHHITLRVSIEPRSAKLYLNEDELPSNPFEGRFARDGISRRLRAVAEGYAPKGVIVVFDQDRTVEASLEQIQGRASTKGRARERSGKTARGDREKRRRRNNEDDPWRD
jgi:eukaryotic-like serine/threonine-protein kinase